MNPRRMLSIAAITLLCASFTSPGISQTRTTKRIQNTRKKTVTKPKTPAVQRQSNAARLRADKNNTYKKQCIEAIEAATRSEVTYNEHACTMMLKGPGSRGLRFSFSMSAVNVSVGTSFLVSCRGGECLTNNRGTGASGQGKSRQHGLPIKNKPTKNLTMCMEWLKNRCKK